VPGKCSFDGKAENNYIPGACTPKTDVPAPRATDDPLNQIPLYEDIGVSRQYFVCNNV